jgi:hypothetical protein
LCTAPPDPPIALDDFCVGLTAARELRPLNMVVALERAFAKTRIESGGVKLDSRRATQFGRPFS